MNRVLVVDDEPQILRALAINLRARRYEVFTAETGTEALSVAAAHPPDLVILDLGSARHGRRRGHPRPARLDRRSHRDPLGTHRQRGQGRRAGRGRRRLPDQAVRDRRADGTDARRRSPGDTRRRTTNSDLRTDDRRPGRAPSHASKMASGPSTFVSPRPSGTCSRCCCATRESCSAAASSSRRSGDPATRPPAATCGSTWPSCARSSKPTPHDPGTCSPNPGMGYRFQPDQQA